MTPGSAAVEPVSVGATAIIASAGLFVGIERGYFSQQGLDVQTTIVANSNDTLPLVATGKMDVANNAVTAFMVNAVNDGVNMKWVAGQASYTPKHGTLGLVVRKELYDSGQVRSLKDLKGRKVAVPIIAGGGAIVLDKGLAQGWPDQGGRRLERAGGAEHARGAAERCARRGDARRAGRGPDRGSGHRRHPHVLRRDVPQHGVDAVDVLATVRREPPGRRRQAT